MAKPISGGLPGARVIDGRHARTERERLVADAVSAVQGALPHACGADPMLATSAHLSALLRLALPCDRASRVVFAAILRGVADLIEQARPRGDV